MTARRSAALLAAFALIGGCVNAHRKLGSVPARTISIWNGSNGPVTFYISPDPERTRARRFRLASNAIELVSLDGHDRMYATVVTGPVRVDRVLAEKRHYRIYFDAGRRALDFVETRPIGR